MVMGAFGCSVELDFVMEEGDGFVLVLWWVVGGMVCLCGLPRLRRFRVLSFPTFLALCVWILLFLVLCVGIRVRGRRICPLTATVAEMGANVGAGGDGDGRACGCVVDGWRGEDWELEGVGWWSGSVCWDGTLCLDRNVDVLVGMWPCILWLCGVGGVPVCGE